MAKNNAFSFLALAMMAVLAGGCAKGFDSGSQGSVQGGDDSNPQGPGENPPVPNPGNGEDLKFCSYLSFSDITWSSELTQRERRSFGISLSLSGSFEGRDGWFNLTNNFDGMGLSAGLLNQTLGTGSLQPLLRKMRIEDPSVFYKHFSRARADSVLKMLRDWESANGLNFTTENFEDIQNITSSALDMDQNLVPFSGESASVTWAKNNLYVSNGNFKPEWSNEWKKFLADSKYASIQIQAAQLLHEKALGYVERIDIPDLRTYLLMFDFVVQNGGLKESEFAEVDTLVRQGQIVSDTDKLMALLKIRLRRVNPQWVEDVRKRKTAIINGSGVVHGTNRNFPREFCFAQNDQIL